MIAVVCLAFIAALAGTWLVLANAERLGLVQEPNARSSHLVRTRTAGGLGIVLGVSAAGLVLAATAPMPLAVVLLAGLAIAAVGLIDVLHSLPAGWRLFWEALIVAATLGLSVPVAGLGIPLPTPLVFAVVLIAMVYWINLFNFMDGIDGLAGSQAAFIGFAAAAVAFWTVPGITADPLFWSLLILGAAALGFLVFNWPPARIFMGDVGSLYLGFLVAVLALASSASGWLSLSVWLILVGLFAVDATVTLLRRLLRGEPILLAHRRHAYQRLAVRYGGHLPVTLLYLAINVLWLLPLAFAAQLQPAWAWPIVVIAYLPLVALALYAGAGRPEASRPAP